MNRVTRFLATLIICGALVTSVLFLRLARSVTIGSAAPVMIDETAKPVESLASADPAPSQSFKVLETLIDRCYHDVVVKAPFSNATSPDHGDIILARSPNMCKLVQGSTPAYSGVCQTNVHAYSDYTLPITYDSIKRTSDRRFRWICGGTKERSRCPSDTYRVRFRLGVAHRDRLLETQCLE